jgi:hypothetical protein
VCSVSPGAGNGSARVFRGRCSREREGKGKATAEEDLIGLAFGTIGPDGRGRNGEG